MAKRSLKKFAFYDKQKETTSATAFAVLQKLVGVDEYTLLNNIFFSSDDPVLRKLVNKVEYILTDAVVNPKRFQENLHPALLKLSDEIKSNNLIPKFFELVHVMYERHHSVAVGNIADAYYNLIIQLATYLTPTGNIVVGLTKSGETLYVPEMYPDTDKIVYTVVKMYEKRGGDILNFNRDVVKEFNKQGYKDVKTYDDIDYMFMNERLTTDVLFVMTPFIHSMDSPLLDFPYISARLSDFKIPRRVLLRKNIEEALRNRRRLLPKGGITIENIDNTKGIESVWLSEQLYLDKLFMLYKVKVNGESLVGYYNTESGFFFSVFLDTPVQFQENHWAFKDFLLEIYANLTTDYETDITMYVADDKPSTQGRKGTPHRLDKASLKETVVDVDFYTRKLPMDATASPEAVALAKKYGIKLYPGETFVKPFKRRAYNRTKED